MELKRISQSVLSRVDTNGWKRFDSDYQFDEAFEVIQYFFETDLTPDLVEALSPIIKHSLFHMSRMAIRYDDFYPKKLDAFFDYIAKISFRVLQEKKTQYYFICERIIYWDFFHGNSKEDTEQIYLDILQLIVDDSEAWDMDIVGWGTRPDYANTSHWSFYYIIKKYLGQEQADIWDKKYEQRYPWILEVEAEPDHKYIE